MASRRRLLKPAQIPSKWQDILLDIPGYNSIETAGDCVFDVDEAKLALDFFPEMLRHVEGNVANRPFVLEHWQKAFIANLLGWKMTDELGRIVRRYRETLLYVSRKNGKCLAVDTPIPTPDGWVNIGDLKRGDVVFDDQGSPCNVTAAHDVQYGNECYRVMFSDGTSIVADADHLWETEPKNNGLPRVKKIRSVFRLPRRRRILCSTRQILETLTVGKKTEWNHRIGMHGPLVTNDADLPIDPYVLGAWLGDGDSDTARLTCSENDMELIDNLRKCNVLVTKKRSGRKSSASRFLIQKVDDGKCRRGHDRSERNAKGRCLACERETDAARNLGDAVPPIRLMSIQEELRALGVLDDKHIPQSYLRASIAQRQSLMQGLMDTDGYCSKAGQCEFTTTKPALRDGFMELARSLSYKVSVHEKRATINGVDCGPKWRILFGAFSDNSPFRLSRKSSRLKRRPKNATRATRRQIVSVKPVESVPVRCITVDSPSRLFLAGEGMVQTHNSPIVAGLGLLIFFCDGEYGQQCFLAAGEKEQAGMLFRHMKGMVEAEPALAKRCQIYGGNATAGQSKSLVRPDENSYLRVISADASGKHGGNTHLAIVDELHTQPNRDLIDVLQTSMASANRKQPLMVCITTADYDRPSICNEKYDYAVKVRDGIVPNRRFLPVIYEVPRDADWKDESNWKLANPNLGVSVSLDYLRDECKRAQEIPAYEFTFRRLHLNQRTSSADKCIPLDQWDRCKDASINVAELDGRDCCVALDIGARSDFCALARLFPHDDAEVVSDDAGTDPNAPAIVRRSYTLLMDFWLPKKPVKRDANIERDIEVWRRQGHIRTTPGDAVDFDAMYHDIVQILSPYRVRNFLFDRGFEGLHLGQMLQAEYGDRVESFPQTLAYFNGPFREFLHILSFTRLHHDGNPVMRWMVSNVVAEYRGGLMKPSKDKSSEKIDGVTAMLMAIAAGSRPDGENWFSAMGGLRG